MEKLTALTRDEILSFHLGDYWMNFIESFMAELEKELKIRISDSVNKMSEQVKVLCEFDSIYKESNNFNMDNTTNDEYITIIFGNVGHHIQITLSNFRTIDVIDLSFESNIGKETSIQIPTEEIFSDSMLTILADWLLTCTFPDEFIERLKKEGLYEKN